MTRLIVLILSIATAAAGVLARQQIVPAGNWQSVRSETYNSPLHPVVTGAELYLNIDIASDGSFRGQWGEYTCVPSIGAYGYSTYPCRSSARGGRVSGNLSPAGQGVIELEKLGRSAFNWSTPSSNQLEIDLPRNWKGSDAVFHRARMTRDGKPKPPPPKPDEGPLLSAAALYREFLKDEQGTLAKYKGRTLALEGRRGTLIQLSDGGAAIHVPDGYQPRALVLSFRRLSDVSGIDEGAQFRFRCSVDDWDYQYVHLGNCTVVR
jgi:hypothetical protein